MSEVHYGMDYNYAYSRLKNSIVRLKNEPVTVINLDLATGEVVYSGLGKKGNYKAAPLEEFDLSPIPLGYVNLHQQCTLVSRRPERYYKQGLTTSTYQSSPFPCTLHSKEFYNTVIGRYPKPIDCLEKIVCGEATTQAFSRCFAFVDNGLTKESTVGLVFRRVLVGKAIWNPAGKNINYQLEEQYQYLQEMLEEAINV
jgi:hypothetical protein